MEDDLLTENGGNLLLEDAGSILLEDSNDTGGGTTIMLIGGGLVHSLS